MHSWDMHIAQGRKLEEDHGNVFFIGTQFKVVSDMYHDHDANYCISIVNF